MIMEIVLLVVVIAAGGYFAYDYFYKKARDKQLGKIIRILLWEKVGSDEVYQGERIGVEDKDKVIGAFIMIGKDKKPITNVSSSSYDYDPKYGKCLSVVKYSSDDYRVRQKLKEGDWYKRVDLDPTEYLEHDIQEDEQGNKSIVLKTNKHGDYIPIMDKDGNPKPSYRLESYTSPLAVTQQAREAIRFERDYERRMEAKRNEKAGWWDKYGGYAMLGGMLIIFLVMSAYQTNKITKSIDNMVDKFSEKSDESIKATKDPLFIQNVLDYVEKKNKESEAPPS